MVCGYRDSNLSAALSVPSCKMGILHQDSKQAHSKSLIDLR